MWLFIYCDRFKKNYNSSSLLNNMASNYKAWVVYFKYFMYLKYGEINLYVNIMSTACIGVPSPMIITVLDSNPGHFTTVLLSVSHDHLFFVSHDKPAIGLPYLFIEFFMSHNVCIGQVLFYHISLG